MWKYLQVVVDWNEACVKDSRTGQVIPIRQAVRDGVISRETGELLNKKLDALPFRGHDVPVQREEKDKKDAGEEDDTVTLTFQTTKVVEPSVKAITVEEQMDTGKTCCNWSLEDKGVPSRNKLKKV